MYSTEHLCQQGMRIPVHKSRSKDIQAATSAHYLEYDKTQNRKTAKAAGDVSYKSDTILIFS